MIASTSHYRIPGVKNIIAIASAKGGVGKTFIAANLALACARAGKKTGLLDADIACPNLFTVLGVEQKLKPTEDNKLIPVEKFGMKIISMAGLCSSEDEVIVWRGPIITKIIQQFMKETVWGELDTLVIDLPSGAGDAALTILQNFAVDGILVVTTPQRLAMIDAKRTINMAVMLKVPVLGIVENMRGEFFGEGGGSSIAAHYRIPFLASIPMKKQIVGSEELEMIFSKMARTIGEKIMVQ